MLTQFPRVDQTPKEQGLTCLKLCQEFYCQRKQKKYGTKLEGKVRLREEKCLLESSETTLNVVGNHTIEKKKRA